MVIGGKNDKTVDIYLTDSSLFKKAEISHDLFRPAHFASEYFVLLIESVDTIHDILPIYCSDQYSQIILSCTLLLMRVYLASVNTKGGLTSKQKISMLWSSYILLLHVDGLIIKNKSNWTCEIISLSLLTMLNEVIRPHHLTSELSENCTVVVISLCRYFTVNNLISILQKLIRFRVTISNGDLKVSMSTQRKFYVETVHHKNMRKYVELHSGSICVETDPGVIEAEKNIYKEALLQSD